MTLEHEIRATITLPSGESLTVRNLRAGDGPALQRFNAGLSTPTRTLFLPHVYDDATITRVIERAETGVDLTYIVLDGAEIVAYFFLWDVQESIPVLGIGMTDAYQGKGLGRKLMEILIEDGRRRERDGIDLTTMQTNDRAFALYQKMGFQYVSDVDNIVGDGTVVVERWMFLPLKSGAQPVAKKHGPPA